MIPRRRLTAKPRPPFAPANTVLVYVEGGQSNSDGSSGGSTSFSYTFVRTQTWWKANQESTALATFQDFALGVNTNSEAATRPDPSIYAAQVLEGTLSNEIKVIQAAEGGQGFENGAGKWAAGGSLRSALEKGFVKAGLSSLAGTDEIYLLPLFWIQGERDATSTTFANGYEAQLRQFISDFRNWVGIADFPVVIVLLHKDLTPASYPTADTVRQAMITLAAEDRNVYLLRPDETPLGGDSVHYTDVGFNFLADRFLHLARKIGTRKYQDSGEVGITNQPAISQQTSSSVTISVTASEYGTLYAGVYSNGSSNPGHAAIKGASGTGYITSGSVDLIYDVANTLQISGLTASTEYEVFAFVEDLAGNQSTIQALPLTTNAPAGGVVFEDTFTEATTIDLASHTPDTGTGWTAYAGQINVDSATGRAVGTSDSVIASYVANNVPNGVVNRVESSVILDSTPIHGLIFRAQDLNNFLVVFVRSAAPEIRLFQNIAGSYSEITSFEDATLVTGQTVSLAIEWNASEFRISLDGVLVDARTDSTLSGSNGAGIEMRRASHIQDDFKITELGAFSV